MGLKLAVIGGGPIGLYTANILAEKGHQVTLFEKGSWPIDKACGQGIMPSGVSLLSHSGVEFTLQRDAITLAGITYIDGDVQLTGSLPSKGLGVERLVLSQKLWNKVSPLSNVKLRSKTKVTNISISDNIVKINNEVHPEETFSYVFACDGLHSQTRNILQNEKLVTNNLRLGGRVHFSIPPWSQNVEVYWKEGVEAYVTPVSSQKIEVAFLWYQSHQFSSKNLEQQLFELFPELKEKLHNHSSCNDFRAYGPFDKRSKSLRVGPVFFIGDAYKFFDGITGEGISIGLRSAQIICQNFQNFSWYHKLKIHRMYFFYSMLVSTALWMSRHPHLRRKILQSLKKFPRFFNLILTLNDC